MSDSDCIFCKIVSGEIPAIKLYENDAVIAFLDTGPISDGHTLVVPKQHFARLDECPAEVLGEIGARLGKIAKAVSAAMESDGYNVLCNTGRAAGQVVEHLHFHIIPRSEGDGVFNRWPAYKYEDGKADEIVNKIREKL